ncbi:MAG: hypothetical protein IK088_09610, partial [Lachnospiraceae bacterium]|nr:hypothetical protein [Lachnospiraceae bacterium]
YTDLSAKEIAILSSGFMNGTGKTVSAPGDSGDELIHVDTDAHTITADPYVDGETVWNPISARVVYTGGNEDVTLTDNSGTFTYTGNDYRVEVVYQYDISIDPEEQQKLLNGPYYLEKGIENLDTVADEESSFYTIGSNIDALVKLIDGSLPFGAKLSNQDTVNAIARLKAETQVNGGFLNIDLMITEGYEASQSATQYLVAHGSEFKAATVGIYNALNQIANDEGVETIALILKNQSTSDYNLYRRAISALNNTVRNIEDAAADSWDILDSAKNPLKSGMTTAEYKQLDTLVRSEGTTSLHTGPFMTTMTGATMTVSRNVNQNDVTIVVRANRIAPTTIDSSETTALEDHETVIQVLTGSDAAAVEAAASASGIEGDALQAWGVIDPANYDRTVSDLPETLTGNVTYTITYNPKAVAMTYDFTGLPETLPYGYHLTLPKNTNPEKVYDYVVNGAAYMEGEIITILAPVTITRTEDRPWDVNRLAELVARSYSDSLTEKEQAVLSSVALKSTNILVRTPKNEDNLVSVETEGSVNTVTAAEYPSGIEGIVWKPQSGNVLKGGETIAELDLTGQSASFSGLYDSVNVVYVLTLTQITEEQILREMNVVNTLAMEAKAAKDDMAILNSQYAQLGQLDQATMNKIQVGVNGSDMSEESKNAVKAILNGCINKDDVQLYLYGYLTSYRENGLTYYYQDENYLKIRNQVDILRTNFNTVYQDPEFLPLLALLEVDEYYDKIGQILEKLNAVEIPGPNERIDVVSPSLGELVNAIEGVIGAGRSFDSADRPVTLSTTLTSVSPDQAVVTIVVQQKNSSGDVIRTGSDMAVFAKDAVLSADDVQLLLGKQASLVTSLGIDTQHYSTENELGLNLGTTLTESVEAAFTYTPNRYVTKITDKEGAEIASLPFWFDVPSITLPKCEESGKRYRYTVAGTEYTVSTEAKILTFTAEDIDEGRYAVVTRETVDINRETLLGLIRDFNEAAAASGLVDNGKLTFSFIPMENESGEFVILIRTSPDDRDEVFGAIGKIAEAMIGSNFAYIKAGDEYVREDSQVSLQAILDMILYSGLSLDSYLNAITEDGQIIEMTLPEGYSVIGASGNQIPVGSNRISNVDLPGAKLFETTLTFAENANDDGIRAKCYVTLEDFGENEDGLRTYRSGLSRVREHFNFLADQGTIGIETTLSESSYGLYLTMLLALNHATLSDVTDVDMVAVFDIIRENLEFIIADDEITVQTFENTLSRAGAYRDMSESGDAYALIRRFLNTILKNASFTNEKDADNVYSADLKFDLNTLMNEMNVPEGIRSILKEQSSGLQAGIRFSVNNNPDYGALIIDLGASSTKMMKFVHETSDAFLSAREGAVIVLLKDIDGDVTLERPVSIDLNGHKISGNLTANAAVMILDSSVSTESGAGIDGTISGNVKIIGGKY